MLRNHLQFGPVPFKQLKFSQENRQERKLLMKLCSGQFQDSNCTSQLSLPHQVHPY